jgi:cob(I)alamin adenosyltransferase
VRIYTKTGDMGETGLLAGPRVAKNHPRIEACGGVDELNAAIGLARCQRLAAEVDGILERVQGELFSLGADIATSSESKTTRWRIGASHIARLEADIDHGEERLAPLTRFILPGGSPAACQLHVARAICRRAERAVVTLGQCEGMPTDVLTYLNRLSDLLFVLARSTNFYAGVPDVVWTSP